MVSKEIRQLTQMSAAPFDTSSQPTMAAMNQLTVSSNSSFSNPLTTTTGKGGRRKDGGGSHKEPKGKGKSGGSVSKSEKGSAGGGGSTGGSGAVGKRSGVPNPKKMYEEMNMIRKVKVSGVGLILITN